jgi:hypothetical protein
MAMHFRRNVKIDFHISSKETQVKVRLVFAFIKAKQNRPSAQIKYILLFFSY